MIDHKSQPKYMLGRPLTGQVEHEQTRVGT